MKIVCSRQTQLGRTDGRTLAFLELLSEPKIDLGPVFVNASSKKIIKPPVFTMRILIILSFSCSLIFLFISASSNFPALSLDVDRRLCEASDFRLPNLALFFWLVERATNSWSSLMLCECIAQMMIKICTSLVRTFDRSISDKTRHIVRTLLQSGVEDVDASMLAKVFPLPLLF